VLQGVGRQFMYHQCETCRRVFTDAEARHRNPDPASERADIVIGREKNREYIAEQRRGTLPARQRSDEMWARPRAVSCLVMC